MKFPPTYFDKSFADSQEGKNKACRHAAYLLNSLDEQRQRYKKSLEDIVEALKVLPGVALALDVNEVLGEEEI